MLQLLAQSYDYTYTTTTTSSGGGASFAFLMLFYFALIVLSIVGMWKVFTKAGKPGWASIIPFYNVWVLAEIAGRQGWFGLLLLIPFVNIVISIILALDIAKNFGKSPVFGIVGLWLFSFIGYLILGFGDAKYHDQAGAPTVADTPYPTSAAPVAPPATNSGQDSNTPPTPPAAV